jgi:hypothetical protein
MSEPLDAEKNAELYPLVAAGDAAARERMIGGNMPLVLFKVEAFIRCFPNVAYLRDDLVSAGCIGLVKAVNKMADGDGPRKTDVASPTDFLGMWINRELGEVIEEESLVRLPPRSKYRARTEGRELGAPVVHNVLPERVEVPSYEKEMEMRELIESCCMCDEQRTFVAMREAGHTYAEIAAAVNMRPSSTYVMGRELDARVQRKLAALLNA